MKRSPRVAGVGRTNRPSPRGVVADVVKGFGDVSIVNIESQATEINLNASTSSLEHPGKTTGPVMRVIAGSASSVSPRVFEAMRTAPRRRDFIATTRPARSPREDGARTLAPQPPPSSRSSRSSRVRQPPPPALEPEPEPAAAPAEPTEPESFTPPPPSLAPLRAHAYEEKVAGRSVVTGHDADKKLKKLLPEVERKGKLEDYEKRKHVLEVIHELQNKFYQKFTRPEDAHAFFDVNGDGDIDEGEFCDVLRYAGCWNGMPLARATFKALIGQENDVLSVAEFVERLLVPNHETDKEITDRLRMTSTKAPTPAELTNQEHAIVTRFTAQLAQQKKHMNFSVRPLFRKMKSDGSGFLTYDEFRDILGQDCLNLGLSESEVSTLIAAVDTSNKGAVTYADLSRRLATADLGRDHDAMLASSTRELQSVRAHASRLASELETAVQSSGEADTTDDGADGASHAENEYSAIGPLHAQPFSNTTNLGSTAPGVGWGGKSQAELFHTMSEHEPPNDITLPPQSSFVKLTKPLRTPLQPRSPRSHEQPRPSSSRFSKTRHPDTWSRWMMPAADAPAFAPTSDRMCTTAMAAAKGMLPSHDDSAMLQWCREAVQHRVNGYLDKHARVTQAKEQAVHNMAKLQQQQFYASRLPYIERCHELKASGSVA